MNNLSKTTMIIINIIRTNKKVQFDIWNDTFDFTCFSSPNKYKRNKVYGNSTNILEI